MVERRIERAKATLRKLFERSTPVCVAWSSGKDSSCCGSLVLTTAAELKTRTPIVFLHADTLVENPEITAYAQGEMEAIRRYAEEHGLNVRIETAVPNLSSTWVTRVIGGRGLPIFPNSKKRDCTVDWKIAPMLRLRKRLMKELGSTTTPPVLITGVRFDESQVRAQRMNKRGESDQVRFDPKLGERRLSLICHWSDSDVWEYLGRARSGEFDGYSNFEETFRIYADSAGTSCAVVADEMLADMGASRACGARTGCWSCCAVGRDRSLENMIAGDPRYAYLAGLNRLQRFLVNSQYDWSRRSPVGRTINDGFIKLQPDTYSPAMLEALLLYCLTLDVEEAEAAAREGRDLRFQILTVDQLIAVDAMWSLYGHHRPFHALHCFRRVYVKGERHHVPQTEPVPRTPLPAPRYVHVGDDWDGGVDWAYAGLRTPELELLGERDCIGTRAVRGKVVMDVVTEELFSVDMESAYLVLDLELERLLAEYHDNPLIPVTEGFKYYVRVGTLTLSPGQVTEHDDILRRTAHKSRHGFVGDGDLENLTARSIGEAEWKRRVAPKPVLPAPAVRRPAAAQLAMF